MVVLCGNKLDLGDDSDEDEDSSQPPPPEGQRAVQLKELVEFAESHDIIKVYLETSAKVETQTLSPVSQTGHNVDSVFYSVGRHCLALGSSSRPDPRLEGSEIVREKEKKSGCCSYFVSSGAPKAKLRGLTVRR
jgi:GTPase SAR1 family protein